MTDATVSDLALQEALIGLLSTSGGTIRVHLHTDDVTFDPTSSDPAQFTEAAYPGYAFQPWGFNPISGPAVSRPQLTPAVVAFPAPTSGGNVDVWGWWADYQSLQTGTRRVLMASRFTAPPRTIIEAGAPLTFNLFFEDFDFSRP